MLAESDEQERHLCDAGSVHPLEGAIGPPLLRIYRPVAGARSTMAERKWIPSHIQKMRGLLRPVGSRFT